MFGMDLKLSNWHIYSAIHVVGHGVHHFLSIASSEISERLWKDVLNVSNTVFLDAHYSL
jgi:hypothetical protein